MPDVKSDLEIARAATIKPINEIADVLSIPPDRVNVYGSTKAKVDTSYLEQTPTTNNGKLVLVTGISPTPAGEGKSTTTVGLGDALNRIGKQTMICLREPSLRHNEL